MDVDSCWFRCVHNAKAKKKRAGRCESALFHTLPFKFSRFILSYYIIFQIFLSFHPILHKHHTMMSLP